jgi:hypothetical protein
MIGKIGKTWHKNDNHKKDRLVFLDTSFLRLSKAIKWFLLPRMQWHFWLINISSSPFNY